MLRCSTVLLLAALPSLAVCSMLNDFNLMWEDAEVPFVLSVPINMTAVYQAINFWSDETCIRFLDGSELTPNYPAIGFSSTGNGCFGSIGKASVRQQISVDADCGDFATITGLIAQALGAYYEHTRADRNQYISVDATSVHPILYFLYFSKVIPRHMNDYVVDYDYGSVLHFAGFEQSWNGSRVITTLDSNYQRTIGQIEGPTFADVKKVNRAYCSTNCGNWPNTCKNGGYLDPRMCIFCKCPPPLRGQFCEIAKPTVSGCGTGDLTATNNFQTLSVSGDMLCYYLITAPLGKQVNFSLTSMTIRSTGPIVKRGACLYNYLEINYRKDFTYGGARFCNGTMPTATRSQSNKLVLTYKGHAGAQFSLQYKAL